MQTKLAFPINKERHLFVCEKVHISRIKRFDTVFHNGEAKTVGKNSLMYDKFFGYTLFGDPYLLGEKPVIRFKTTSGGRLVPVE